MSIIFIGVKVLVTAGKYKGKTGRIHSYTQKTCTLIGDGESTTIQEIADEALLPRDVNARAYTASRMPTGNIKREHLITIDWKTPPSSYFIRSNGNAIFESLLKYCTEQYPEYLRALRRESPHASTAVTPLGRMMEFPVYSTYFCVDRNREGWLEEWWPLYCDAFYDRKPEEALKIQALVRMYFQHKKYLEILSLKPGGEGYMKVKAEFESCC